MRIATALVAFLLVLPLAPLSVPAQGSPADPAARFFVPAGSGIVLHAVDGIWRTDVLPAASVQAASHGVMECDMDLPAPSYEHEAVAFLAPNPNYPLSRNTQSQGTCAAGLVPVLGPLSWMELQTAGDVGGYVLVVGYDSFGDIGELKLDCRPVGMVASAMAGPEPVFVGTFAGASCTETQSGLLPSLFEVWEGYVATYNVAAGGSTYGAAF